MESPFFDSSKPSRGPIVSKARKKILVGSHRDNHSTSHTSSAISSSTNVNYNGTNDHNVDGLSIREQVQARLKGEFGSPHADRKNNKVNANPKGKPSKSKRKEGIKKDEEAAVRSPSIALPSSFPVKPIDPFVLDPKRRLRDEPRMGSQESISSISSSDLPHRRKPTNHVSSKSSRQMGLGSVDSAVAPKRDARISVPESKLHRRRKLVKLQNEATDSPDPLMISVESGDAGLASPTLSSRTTLKPKTLRAKSKLGDRSSDEVLIPSSGADKPIGDIGQDKKQACSDRESSGGSSTESDHDKTPRQINKSSGQGKSSKNGKRVIALDESMEIEHDDGAAFFKRMRGKVHQSQDQSDSEREPMEVQWAGIEVLESSSDYPTSSPLSPAFPRDQDIPAEDNERGMCTEEKAYCAAFVNPNDLCLYCSGPMPLNPSRHLLSLQERLSEVEAELSPGRGMTWQRTIDFCSLHEAEATIIPIGLRIGYPANIDFHNLQERLEERWIREELEAITFEPHRSAFFNKTIKDIQKKGKGKWSGLSHQSDERVVQLTMPGYYGHLGRAIIDHHFQNLLRWKFLPNILPRKDRPSLIFPLTSLEFITHVLVPEAAIRLIMCDQGWKGELDDTTPEWSLARTEAFRLRRESAEFGRWMYRAEGDYAHSVLDQIQDRQEETRKACIWRRKRPVDEHRVVEVTDSSSNESAVFIKSKRRGRAKSKSRSSRSSTPHSPINQLVTIDSSSPIGRNYKEKSLSRQSSGYSMDDYLDLDDETMAMVLDQVEENRR